MQKEKKQKNKQSDVNEGSKSVITSIEDEKAYISIDELVNQGINAGDIGKLKSAGICTIKGFLMVTKKELLNIKGISEQKLEKMQGAAQKLENLTFMNANEVLLKRNKIKRITTGSNALDDMLCGGVESQAITEVFGEFRTGKTQLALTLCVTAQLQQEQRGGNGKVIFIDTENTFRPERIQQICQRFNVDSNSILENIKVARAYTVDHLNSLLLHAAKQMYIEEFSLLIVDSIMAPFRVDFAGRGELSERQQILGRTLSRLIKISEQFNVAVFIVNQVMADPSGTMGDCKKPIGGNILAHASTTRLYLKKGKGENRICKVYDSPLIPETECTYKISEGGIVDSTD